jgi:hypothetical protein
MFGQVAVLVVGAVAIVSGGRFFAAAATYSSESPISLFVLLTVFMALPLLGVARRARNVDWRTALGPLVVQAWLIICPLFTIPSRFWVAGPWLLLCIAWWMACAGTLTLLARASNVWPLVAPYLERHRR